MYSIRRPTNFHQSAVPAIECLANKVLRNQCIGRYLDRRTVLTDETVSRDDCSDTGMFTTSDMAWKTSPFNQRIDMVMLGLAGSPMYL